MSTQSKTSPLAKRLFWIYSAGGLATTSVITYFNIKNGALLLSKVYELDMNSREAKDEGSKMLLSSIGKGFMYGLAWPFTLSKMYNDYIGNNDFMKHTHPMYNDEKYYMSYKAMKYINAFSEMFQQK